MGRCCHTFHTIVGKLWEYFRHLELFTLIDSAFERRVCLLLLSAQQRTMKAVNMMNKVPSISKHLKECSGVLRFSFPRLYFQQPAFCKFSVLVVCFHKFVHFLLQINN
jgi:hypothetical protein